MSPKEASLIIELGLEGGETITLTVGALFERVGYFAQSSVWPEAVFFLAGTKVEPLLRGVGYFAKERVASAP